jgi:hypothetical protein
MLELWGVGVMGGWNDGMMGLEDWENKMTGVETTPLP